MLSSRDLKRRFTARGKLLRRLIRAFEVDNPQKVVQPQLVVGHRGSGKTTLLYRIQVELRENPSLAPDWLPLAFSEEHYSLQALVDLWVKCLESLADTLEQNEDRRLRDLERDITQIGRRREERNAHMRALNIIKKWSRILERRFVLLVDNIDAILERLSDRADGEEGWALKKAFSEGGHLAIIGATCHPLEAPRLHIQLRGFVDLFKVYTLEPLDDEETYHLLLRLAELNEAPHVEWLVKREIARVRTIRLLAGGNARTMVKLFEMLQTGLAGDIRVDLERILDELTPLYKHRLDRLGWEAQRIFSAVADSWHPVSTTKIVALAREEPASTQYALKSLVRAGIVEKIPGRHEAGGGEDLWQVSERFFNIWHLMRNGSRESRRSVNHLVKFLRVFFNYEQSLAHEVARLNNQGLKPDEMLRQAEGMLAMRSTRPIFQSFAALPAVDSLEDWERLAPYLGRKAASSLTQAMASGLIEDEYDIEAAALHSLDLRCIVSALRLVFEPESARRGQLPEYAVLDEDKGLTSEVFPVLVWIIVTAHGEPTLAEGDKQSALTSMANRVWQLEPSTAMQWFMLAEVERKIIGRPVRAERAYQQALKQDQEFAAAWRGLGQVLRCHLFRLQEAEDAYRQCLILHESNAECWRNLGFLLIEQDQLKWAARSFERAATLEPQNAFSWHCWGSLLNSMGRNRHALEMHKKAASLEKEGGEYHHALAYAYLMVSSEQCNEALRAASKAARLQRDTDHYRCAMVLSEIAILQGQWKKAFRLAKQYFENVPQDRLEAQWPEILRFLTVCVRHGYGAELKKLLRQTGQYERMQPVAASMETLLPGKLAPEVRMPAAAIAAHTGTDAETRVIDMQSLEAARVRRRYRGAKPPSPQTEKQQKYEWLRRILRGLPWSGE